MPVLHHDGMTVSDLDRSLAFWRDALGMETVVDQESRGGSLLEGSRDSLQILSLLWHESGQDLGVFCYRIGCGALTVAHSRALELAPVALTVAKTSLRKTDACSKRSYTFFARSTTPTD